YDRAASEEEQDYMSSWVKRLKMPMELIKEACVRTVNQTGKASFAYTNGILVKWYDAGVTTPAQVKELDEEHKKSSAPKPKPAPKKTTKANDYEQRSYDESTLEEIFARKAGE
ncbi:MAG: DnaD domain protein, partial [Firmicutes bacterium]|nr:DnaD domain protein [Bacillota bacterium]